jgi:hypothetical protein
LSRNGEVRKGFAVFFRAALSIAALLSYQAKTLIAIKDMRETISYHVGDEGYAKVLAQFTGM